MFNKYKNKEEIMEEKMLEKGKTYTYDEIEKIFLKAQSKTIEKLDKQAQETMEKEGKIDSSFGFMFSLQNIMATGTLHGILFNDNNNE